MAGTIKETAILLRDDFSTNGSINSSVWDYNHWSPGNDNASFYGNTQQRQSLPEARNGFLQLQLDTHNPSNGDPNHLTFLGSEAISKQKFDLSTGVAFEFSGRFVQDQRGIVAGLFTYAGTANRHDEIDFEALTNRPTTIQSNIYANEPLGGGQPRHHDIGGSLSETHTYRIEWLPDSVRWLIDGKEVRVETKTVPTMPMAVHLNIWAPDRGWGDAYDASLVAVNGVNQNRSYQFEVDYVQVSKLSVVQGAGGNDMLFGTAANDAIYGNQGDDVLAGGAGDDLLVGGAGVDAAHYDIAAAAASVTRNADGSIAVTSRSHGNDTLRDVEILRFSDQVMLANKPQGLSPDLFDAKFYLAMNPDVAAALEMYPMVSAWAHYAFLGAREGRDPNVLFDEQWYLARNPDVAAAVGFGMINSGYQHYQLFGWREDRDPSRWFDASAYREANPGVDASGLGPLAHYLMVGADQGLRIVGVPGEAGV